MGAVVALLAGASVCLLALFVRRDTQPSYMRKSLREWALEYNAVYGYTAGWTSYSPYFSHVSPTDDAETALRQIGPRAVPWLLKWLRYQTPGYKLRLYRALDALPRGKLQDFAQKRLAADRHVNWQQVAVRAFLALGNEGNSAVPELCRMINDPISGEALQGEAVLALINIGDAALPCLMNAIKDRQFRPRFDVVNAVALMNPGTNGSALVGLLVTCLADEDLAVAESAARALGKLRLEPERAVPALIAALQTTNSGVRHFAAYSLADFGSAATSAVPLLTANLTNEDALVRMTASNCLQKLASDGVEGP